MTIKLTSYYSKTQFGSTEAIQPDIQRRTTEADAVSHF